MLLYVYLVVLDTCISSVQSFSRVQLFATFWTVAHKALLSMGFSRQECWSGLLCLPPGIFPTEGLNLHLLHWQVEYLQLSHMGILIKKFVLNHFSCVQLFVTLYTVAHKALLSMGFS